MSAIAQAEKRVRDAEAIVETKKQIFAAARARSSAVTPGGLDDVDHGVLSGTSRKFSQRANTRRMNAYDAEARAAGELDVAEKALGGARRGLELAHENASVEYSREQLEAAKEIRTWRGWERIVRVNRSSVKVFRAAGEDDLVKLAKILEVR